MGEALVRAAAEVVAADVASLTDDECIGQLRECRRVMNMLEGAMLDRLEKVDRRGMIAAEHGSTQAWLRSEPLVDYRTACRMVHLARDLADVLPATRALLLAGEISADHAQQIARLRKHANADAIAIADEELSALATQVGVKELSDAVHAAIHMLKPEQLAGDERTAYEQRELNLATTFGGVGVGNWLLDPVSHDTVATAIHAASPPAKADERSAAQRRADALVTISRFFLKHAIAENTVATDHGVPPQVTVICPLDTLIGLTGAPTATTGLGARISGDAARRIACDAGIARIITAPNSEILDAGRAMRTFTAAARRAVAARDQHCRWPGCGAPPSWCETHHITHWAAGGRSDPDNAILLCGRHHDRVHHHKHQIRIKPDGSRTVSIQRDSAKQGWVNDQRRPMAIDRR